MNKKRKRTRETNRQKEEQVLVEAVDLQIVHQIVLKMMGKNNNLHQFKSVIITRTRNNKNNKKDQKKN